MGSLRTLQEEQATRLSCPACWWISTGCSAHLGQQFTFASGLAFIVCVFGLNALSIVWQDSRRERLQALTLSLQQQIPKSVTIAAGAILDLCGDDFFQLNAVLKKKLGISSHATIKFSAILRNGAVVDLNHQAQVQASLSSLLRETVTLSVSCC